MDETEKHEVRYSANYVKKGAAKTPQGQSKVRNQTEDIYSASQSPRHIQVEHSTPLGRENSTQKPTKKKDPYKSNKSNKSIEQESQQDQQKKAPAENFGAKSLDQKTNIASPKKFNAQQETYKSKDNKMPSQEHSPENNNEENKSVDNANKEVGNKNNDQNRSEEPLTEGEKKLRSPKFRNDKDKLLYDPNQRQMRPKYGRTQNNNEEEKSQDQEKDKKKEQDSSKSNPNQRPNNGLSRLQNPLGKNKQKLQDKKSIERKKKIIKFFIRHPWVLGIIAFIIFFFLILVSFMGFKAADAAANGNQSSYCGTSSDEYNLITFISTFEGGEFACKTFDGIDGYKAYDGGDGTITVGHGVTNHAIPGVSDYIDQKGWGKYFIKKNGAYYVEAGTCLPINVINSIQLYLVEDRFATPIDSYAEKHGITLTQYQRDALTSFNYSVGTGYTEELILAYGQDGNYERLWNFMKDFVHGYYYGEFITYPGLLSRRKAEFALFVTGDYSDQGIFTARTNANYDYYDSEGVMSRKLICESEPSTVACEIYRQGDSRWSSIPLGYSSSLMGPYGCAVTSIAIGIGCSGTPLTVDDYDAGVFLRKLNAGGCFTPGGAIYWGCGAITQVAPNVHLLGNFNTYGYSIEQKKSLVTSYDPSKTFIVVHISNAQYSTHYETYTRVEGNTFATKDPAIGNVNSVNISDVDQILVYSY